MSRDEHLYLQDIETCCAKALRYTQDMTLDDFQANELVIDAVHRNLEIIGEAASHLTAEMRAHHPGIPWGRVTGLRNLLAHAYFGMDNEVIWDIVQHYVPELLTAVQRTLAGVSDDVDEPQ